MSLGTPQRSKGNPPRFAENSEKPSFFENPDKDPLNLYLNDTPILPFVQENDSMSQRFRQSNAQHQRAGTEMKEQNVFSDSDEDQVQEPPDDRSDKMADRRAGTGKTHLMQTNQMQSDEYEDSFEEEEIEEDGTLHTPAIVSSRKENKVKSAQTNPRSSSTWATKMESNQHRPVQASSSVAPLPDLTEKIERQIRMLPSIQTKRKEPSSQGVEATQPITPVEQNPAFEITDDANHIFGNNRSLSYDPPTTMDGNVQMTTQELQIQPLQKSQRTRVTPSSDTVSENGRIQGRVLQSSANNVRRNGAHHPSSMHRSSSVPALESRHNRPIAPSHYSAPRRHLMEADQFVPDYRAREQDEELQVSAANYPSRFQANQHNIIVGQMRTRQSQRSVKSYSSKKKQKDLAHPFYGNSKVVSRPPKRGGQSASRKALKKPDTGLRGLCSYMSWSLLLLVCLFILVFVNTIVYFNVVALISCGVLTLVAILTIRDFKNHTEPAFEQFERAQVYVAERPIQFRMKYLALTVTRLVELLENFPLYVALITLCWYASMAAMVIEQAWGHFSDLEAGAKTVFFLIGFGGLFLLLAVYYMTREFLKWIMIQMKQMICMIPGCEDMMLEEVERDVLRLPIVATKTRASEAIKKSNGASSEKEANGGDAGHRNDQKEFMIDIPVPDDSTENSEKVNEQQQPVADNEKEEDKSDHIKNFLSSSDEDSELESNSSASASESY